MADNYNILDTVAQQVFSYRQRGVTPIELWYAGPLIAEETFGSGALSNDVLYAQPFHSVIAGTLDRIACRVTTAAASGKIRLGIYNNTSPRVLYPTSLILDSGELLASTIGVKSANLTTILNQNTMYWLALLIGSVNVTMRASTQNYPVGMDSAFNQASGGIKVARAYGALPATYPAGATLDSPGVPLIALRYSA